MDKQAFVKPGVKPPDPRTVGNHKREQGQGSHPRSVSSNVIPLLLVNCLPLDDKSKRPQNEPFTSSSNKLEPEWVQVLPSLPHTEVAI
jgi:hypothetical protein